MDPVRPRAPRGRHGLPVQRPPRPARARSDRAAPPRADPRHAGALRRPADRAGAGRRRRDRRRSRRPTASASCRAAWAIGADGARSAVRGLLGLGFEGFTWPERFVATNVFYDFEAHGYPRSVLQIDPVHGAIIAKIDNRNLWRVTYSESASLPEETVEDRVGERLPDAAAGRRGLDARPHHALQDAPALGRDLPLRPRAAGGRRRARDEPDRAAWASRPGCSTPSRCRTRWRRSRSTARATACSTPGRPSAGRSSRRSPHRRRARTSA